MVRLGLIFCAAFLAACGGGGGGGNSGNGGTGVSPPPVIVPPPVPPPIAQATLDAAYLIAAADGAAHTTYDGFFIFVLDGVSEIAESNGNKTISIPSQSSLI